MAYVSNLIMTTCRASNVASAFQPLILQTFTSTQLVVSAPIDVITTNAGVHVAAPLSGFAAPSFTKLLADSAMATVQLMSELEFCSLRPLAIVLMHKQLVHPACSAHDQRQARSILYYGWRITA